MINKYPHTPPPPILFSKLLPLLVSRLITDPINLSLVPTLETALYIQRSIRIEAKSLEPARIKHQESLVPLQKLLEISASHPSSIRASVLIDAILVYPLHSPVVSQVLTNVFQDSADFLEIWRSDVLPEVIKRLKSSTQREISLATLILLGIWRSHTNLMELILKSKVDVLRGLKTAYMVLSNNGDLNEAKRYQAKEEILIISRQLVLQAENSKEKEEILGFMGNAVSQVGVLEGKDLRADCEALLGLGAKSFSPAKGAISILEERREAFAKTDPRVQSILALFPSIPAHLLLAAFSHPQFSNIPSGSKATAGEQAEPLLACMLNDGQGLPNELEELRKAINQVSLQQGDESRAIESQKKFERRNIFDNEDLDMSRLHIKGSDTALPELNDAIPSYIRNSVQRLIALQSEEEETRRQALADANLLLSDDETDLDDSGVIPYRSRVSGGDSEDSAPVDVSAEAVQVVKPNPDKNGRGMTDKQKQGILRTLYMEDPGLFDRDGVTRRSDGRKKLREKIGWDDGQIEGWRVMLERNPNKDLILEAHMDNMTQRPAPWERHELPAHLQNRNIASGPSSNNEGKSSSRGGKKRQNRGSSGHNNSARTRGHDRKMRQMGI
ncbi:hypothetical protein L204_103351 [Cryptococcus depauperatus]|nr:hypothetical protein L204_01668 [Cryptococcus depauperatus CBS 7855]